MSMRYLGGFITASYSPLKVPNAPTIGTVTAGDAQVSVAFTAPSNVGGSAITSYTVIVTDSSSGAQFSNTGSASPIVVTGLTNGNTYTAQVAAVNSYGPSAYSSSSGSFVPVAPKLYSWGNNTRGQLGLNTITSTSSPVQVGALATWLKVEGGSYGTVATKTDGTLWAWGWNTQGQVGDNTTIYRSSPVQVGALTTWLNVSSGFDGSLAIKTDGTLWSWGKNDVGQLGQNIATTVSRSSPVQVGSLTNWSKVASKSSNCVLAIKTDGTLWAWGQNNAGQLGQNDRVYRSSPVQVGALTTWLGIATGYIHSIAVKTDGTLWTWGANSSGELGQNNTTYRSSPIQIGALTTWSKPDGGWSQTLSTKTDGTMWSWGNNGSGQLGQNTITNLSSPVQVGADTNWLNVSCGNYHTVALKTNGTIWAWGKNQNGQLGQGNVVLRSSPVQIGSGTSWTYITGSRLSSFGLSG